VGKAEIAEAVAVTAELVGRDLSEAALRAMVEDLAGYPEPAVMGALHRCRRECHHRLTLADILGRLDDGRPGAEEAWGMVPRDEAVTVVWTEEARIAWGAAQPMIAEGDHVAARMAFLETYRAAVAQARAARTPPRWSVSLGHDVAGREGPLVEAVERKRLAAHRAVEMLPESNRLHALAGQESRGQLTGPGTPVEGVRNLGTGDPVAVRVGGDG